MNKKKFLLLGIVALAAVLIVASVLYRDLGAGNGGNLSSQEQPQEEQGAQGGQQTPTPVAAPDFTVQDLNGNAVKLSDFQGKPVVVNFWATWCGYCKMEMPDFERVYQDLGDEIHFLMVNVTDGVQETVAKASGYISDSGYTFPVYYDTQYSAAMAYGASSSLPKTFFIDAEGYAIAQAPGAIDEATLRRGIEMITD